MLIELLGEPVVLAWIAVFTFYGYVSAFVTFNYLKQGRVRNIMLFPIFLFVTMLLTQLIRQTPIGQTTLSELAMLIAAPWGAALGLLLDVYLVRRWDRARSSTA